MSAELVNVTTERLARFFWHQRCCPIDDAIWDWHCAEKVLSTLRPYLGVVAGASPRELGAFIDAARSKLPNAEEMVAVLIARDGAPEHARHQFFEARRLSPNNGAHPEIGIRTIENEFAAVCSGYISKRGVSLCGPEVSSDATAASRPRSDSRWFEDGLVAFGPAKELHRLLAIAVGLCRRFMIASEESSSSWKERMHPRIGIGLSGFAAARCLTFAWRSEVVIEKAATTALSSECKHFALAAGVSFLPSDEIEDL